MPPPPPPPHEHAPHAQQRHVCAFTCLLEGAQNSLGGNLGAADELHAREPLGYVPRFRAELLDRDRHQLQELQERHLRGRDEPSRPSDIGRAALITMPVVAPQ